MHQRADRGEDSRVNPKPGPNKQDHPDEWMHLKYNWGAEPDRTQGALLAAARVTAEGRRAAQAQRDKLASTASRELRDLPRGRGPHATKVYRKPVSLLEAKL